MFSSFKSVVGRRTRGYLNSRSAESRVWPIIKCAIFHRHANFTLAARLPRVSSAKLRTRNVESSFSCFFHENRPPSRNASKWFVPVSQRKKGSLAGTPDVCRSGSTLFSIYNAKTLRFGGCVYTISVHGTMWILDTFIHTCLILLAQNININK